LCHWPIIAISTIVTPVHLVTDLAIFVCVHVKNCINGTATRRKGICTGQRRSKKIVVLAVIAVMLDDVFTRRQLVNKHRTAS
jgi:hypothetical protein